MLSFFSLLLLYTGFLPQEQKSDLNNFSWLAGCWEGNYSNGRTVSEQWMKPLGNVMMGMSRTVKNGKTIAYEYVRIEQHDDGTIHYVANPSGQHEASFQLKWAQGTKIIFENLSHDYPQRIIYQLIRPDSLSARIEGRIVSDAWKTSDFPYKRVQCE